MSFNSDRTDYGDHTVFDRSHNGIIGSNPIPGGMREYPLRS